MVKTFVSKEVKEQVLKRIKDDGMPVSKVAEEHGIAATTIYTGFQRKSTLALQSLKLQSSNVKTSCSKNCLDKSPWK